MMFTTSLVLLASIIGTARSDSAPSIVFGIEESRFHNNISINQNGLPPGSVVIGGSALTQHNNEYLTIADTEKLTVVMTDMINLPSQLSILGLNDSDISNLLYVTPQQRKAQVILDLRQSLTSMEELCESMSQLVDRSLIENRDYPKENSQSGYPKGYNEKMWYISLTTHWMNAASCKTFLERLIQKIRSNDSLTDSDVENARNKMLKLLGSYEKLAKWSQEVTSPA